MSARWPKAYVEAEERISALIELYKGKRYDEKEIDVLQKCLAFNKTRYRTTLDAFIELIRIKKYRSLNSISSKLFKLSNSKKRNV